MTEAMMTEAQKSYLVTLLKDKKMPVVLRVKDQARLAAGIFTKAAASEKIVELKTYPWMTYAEKSQFASAATAPEAPKVVNGLGFYRGGVTGKVYSYLKHPTKGYNVWKMMTETNVLEWVEGSGYIVTGKKGSYSKVYSGNAKKDIENGGAKLTMEEVVTHGSLMGYCLCCGRQLTDPKSVAAKIGPVCASKYSDMLAF